MNNKFFRFWWKVGNIVLINILWILCCIPVITVGASCAAMYRAIFDLREGKAGCIKNFFCGFKKCFGLATKVWLCLAAAAGVVYLIPQVVSVLQMQIVSLVTAGALFAVMIILWLLMVCVFPLVAYFDTNLKKTLRNAAFIAIKHRKKSVGSALIAAIPLALLMFVPEIFLWTSGIWALIFPGAVAYLIAKRFTPILESYNNKRKEKEQEVQS